MRAPSLHRSIHARKLYLPSLFRVFDEADWMQERALDDFPQQRAAQLHREVPPLQPETPMPPTPHIAFQNTLRNGVVIGADGFGFVPGPQGLVKVPQTGVVQIDDDVELGANTTVDRARFGRTWVKSNVKVDDQVMIAHNVVIGESSILVAQCGIAGSAELGRGVILGAKAGVNGHITLGDRVQVAGTSGVVKSLPAGSIALGTPAESQREFMARHTLPSRFDKLKAKVEALTAELEALKKAAEK